MSGAGTTTLTDDRPGRSKRHDAIMRLTARHMHASHMQAAPVAIIAEADATALLAVREKLAARHPLVKLTVSTLLIKLVASALAVHPTLNATFADDVLTIYDTVDIGLATTRADGNLIVPVLRDVGARSVDEIAAAAAELVARVRAGKQRLADLQGGGFTISNIGMLPAMRYTTPLLNLPQVGILGVGAISPMVVIREGRAEQRDRIGLSLTFDHRAVNGFAAADFLQTLADMVAAPILPLGLDEAGGDDRT